jgi:hypothetical protein
MIPDVNKIKAICGVNPKETPDIPVFFRSKASKKKKLLILNPAKMTSVSPRGARTSKGNLITL